MQSIAALVYVISTPCGCRRPVLNKDPVCECFGIPRDHHHRPSWRTDVMRSLKLPHSTGEAYEALVTFLDDNAPSWRVQLKREMKKAIREDGQVKWLTRATKYTLLVQRLV